MSIYKLQARTVTTINDDTWTLLTDSDKTFDSYRVYQRAGQTVVFIAFNSNPGENFVTVPVGAQYADEVRHSGGVYAKSADGDVAVEFESKTK